MMNFLSKKNEFHKSGLRTFPDTGDHREVWRIYAGAHEQCNVLVADHAQPGNLLPETLDPLLTLMAVK